MTNPATWSMAWPSGRGAFDPLRSVLWVLFDPDDAELDSVRAVFQHEYNHLIGILGRHLQVCLIDLYLSGSPGVNAVLENERALVESFVPAWLSSPNRLGPDTDFRPIAPEADTTLLAEIMDVCHNLESCQWVLDGIAARLAPEEIARAVQQATLNVGREGELYTPGASVAALHALSALAREVRGRRVIISRMMHGEYYRLVVKVTAPVEGGETPREWAGQGVRWELLELFLVDRIQRMTSFVAKRFTLHERAELVLRWLGQILASGRTALLTETLAGLTSVFMPRVLLPYACFWREAPTRYECELHSLPFPFVPISMPLMTRVKGDQVSDRFIHPTQIRQLQELPELIRHQSTCALTATMADFCEFSLGAVTVQGLPGRAEAVFRRLAVSLTSILQSVVTGRCPACEEIRQHLTGSTCHLLVADARRVLEEAAADYTDWIAGHLEAEFTQACDGSSGTGVTVRVGREIGRVYKYHGDDFMKWTRTMGSTTTPGRPGRPSGFSRLLARCRAIRAKVVWAFLRLWY